MKCRRFTSENQMTFARLSGDYNPLHIDAVASRRLIFGAPVVHGIHALLWSLDCLLVDEKETVELSSIKVIFPKPIRVGEEVFFSFEKQDDLSFRIELSTSQSVSTIITVKLVKTTQQDFSHIYDNFPEKLAPRVITDAEIENDSGKLKLFLNIAAATELFPHLIKCFSPLQIAAILASTRLVGTRCPGLNSIYSEISLSKTPNNISTEMNYEVTKLDKRVGLVLININSPNLSGTIKAFQRPTPLKQENYLSLKKMVGVDEFSDQRALIIGGSRGLGEVVAKLLSGAGAEVKITYHQGKEDAKRIVDDIVSNGGIADCCQYDVSNPEKTFPNIIVNDWMPTHLYYFATPFIFSGAKGLFSPKIFTKFCDYYVAGFSNLVNMLDDFGVKNIFYPSTVAIDELPISMGEYAVAKIASEMLCDFLEKSDQAKIIYKPRFPRVATDQTASITPVNNHNPVPLMLKELRSFKRVIEQQPGEPNK